MATATVHGVQGPALMSAREFQCEECEWIHHYLVFSCYSCKASPPPCARACDCVRGKHTPEKKPKQNEKDGQRGGGWGGRVGWGLGGGWKDLLTAKDRQGIRGPRVSIHCDRLPAVTQHWRALCAVRAPILRQERFPRPTSSPSPSLSLLAAPLSSDSVSSPIADRSRPV